MVAPDARRERIVASENTMRHDLCFVSARKRPGVTKKNQYSEKFERARFRNANHHVCLERRRGSHAIKKRARARAQEPEGQRKGKRARTAARLSRRGAEFQARSETTVGERREDPTRFMSHGQYRVSAAVVVTMTAKPYGFLPPATPPLRRESQRNEKRHVRLPSGLLFGLFLQSVTPIDTRRRLADSPGRLRNLAREIYSHMHATCTGMGEGEGRGRDVAYVGSPNGIDRRRLFSGAQSSLTDVKI